MFSQKKRIKELEEYVRRYSEETHKELRTLEEKVNNLKKEREGLIGQIAAERKKRHDEENLAESYEVKIKKLEGKLNQIRSIAG